MYDVTFKTQRDKLTVNGWIYSHPSIRPNIFGSKQLGLKEATNTGTFTRRKTFRQVLSDKAVALTQMKCKTHQAKLFPAGQARGGCKSIFPLSDVKTYVRSPQEPKFVVKVTLRVSHLVRGSQAKHDFSIRNLTLSSFFFGKRQRLKSKKSRNGHFNLVNFLKNRADKRHNDFWWEGICR